MEKLMRKTMAGKRKYETICDETTISGLYDDTTVDFDRLKEAVEKYSSDEYMNAFAIINHDSWYDSCEIGGLRVGAYRLETDEEYEKRLKANREQRRKIKQRELEAQKKIEDEERAELARLKAKYGENK